MYKFVWTPFIGEILSLSTVIECSTLREVHSEVWPMFLCGGLMKTDTGYLSFLAAGFWTLLHFPTCL